jgi:acyl-CoA reductase-like NAD-dependent aldehyde dehydrogenase
VKRIYVERPKVSAMVEALADRISREVVGDGLAEEVTMGPVHRESDRRRVEGMLDEAQSLGAKVHRPARLRHEDAGSGGYFVSPAVVEGAPDGAAIVAEEQFGPAVPVLGYDTVDEALARANDTSYGLCASVWSADHEVADRLASQLQAGTVFVNNHGTSAMDHRAPFGGWKHSGFGVELGPEGMLAFARLRTVLEFAAPAAPEGR